jgi:hypothetical protein
MKQNQVFMNNDPSSILKWIIVWLTLWIAGDLWETYLNNISKARVTLKLYSYSQVTVVLDSFLRSSYYALIISIRSVSNWNFKISMLMLRQSHFDDHVYKWSGMIINKQKWSTAFRIHRLGSEYIASGLDYLYRNHMLSYVFANKYFILKILRYEKTDKSYECGIDLISFHNFSPLQ